MGQERTVEACRETLRQSRIESFLQIHGESVPGGGAQNPDTQGLGGSVGPACLHVQPVIL